MITVSRIKAPDDTTTGIVIIVDGSVSMDNLKKLVNRATNLWPDASSEIKEFADHVTNDGVMMQDYRSFDQTGLSRKNVPTLTEVYKHVDDEYTERTGKKL